MANATNLTRAKPVTQEPYVRLDLSVDEAQAIMDLMACVGGCPMKTSRRHTDNIKAALGKTGLRWHGGVTTGSIMFTNAPTGEI